MSAIEFYPLLSEPELHPQQSQASVQPDGTPVLHIPALQVNHVSILADKKTELIYLTQFARGWPVTRISGSAQGHPPPRGLLQPSRRVGYRAHFPMAIEPGLYVFIEGKWFVTFRWSDDFGAYQILLERRQVFG